ncbi:hypothetical protein Tsubulata_021990 [Turnera subulata]|uniref:Iron-sulfur cluster biosynthesis family protein n=1 Tax=Turnera subulata TaxID=218843 RepID=A0A9Q0F3K7_9ROSI|nr:hypothetical protein Tsubulata_021990 [Turnera subulata]
MASISTCFTITPKSRLLYSHSRSILLRPPDSFPVTLPFPRTPSSSKPLNSRVSLSLPSAKASIGNVSSASRPGGAVETDKLPSDVRKRTMEAVDACGRRVTLGDVASRAGLKLNEAQKALQALASDTDGFLEVSDEGDVLYVFPKDYRAKLAAKSFRVRVEPLVDKAKAGAEYAIRTAFGTALVASIVLVYTTIILILSSRSDEDNRGSGRRSRSYDTGFTFYLNPTDLFWYWDPTYNRRRQVQTDGGDKMNFIESIFSFVFGDGDPNRGIEEQRWKLIGRYISSNGGVVAAEELAPYLDLQNAEAMNDESYILPVLLRFDGQPEIDEEGNILYRFPSLQRTASSQRSGRKEYVGKGWTDWVGGMEKFFRENKWEFSKTGAQEKAMVIGLGGINLFGVIVLGAMLKDLAVTQNGFIKFVDAIFPLLQIYAGSFFAIPLIRWFLILKRNAEIGKRNKAREQCAQKLELPDISLRRKLLSARDMAQKTFIGQDRIVYRSDKDFIEQDTEARQWDKMFQELEKSD